MAKQRKPRNTWAEICKGLAIAAVMALPVIGMASHGVEKPHDSHPATARP